MGCRQPHAKGGRKKEMDMGKEGKKIKKNLLTGGSYVI
jgi:hypothetical protein